MKNKLAPLSVYVFSASLLTAIIIIATGTTLYRLTLPAHLKPACLLHLHTQPIIWVLDFCALSMGILVLLLARQYRQAAHSHRQLCAEIDSHAATSHRMDRLISVLPFGVFSISSDRTIAPGFGTAIRMLLNHDSEHPLVFPDVFNVNADLIVQYDRWAGLFFNRFDLQEDSWIELTPLTEIAVGSGSGQQVYALTYHPVRDSAGNPLEILVAMTDITKEKVLEERIGQQQQRHEDDLSEIAEIVKMDYATFENFIFESKKIIFESLRILETLTADNVDSELINDLFRKMHTLKSNARAFNFTQLGQMAHTVEDSFALIRDRKLDITGQLLEKIRQDVSEIESKLDSIISLAKSVMSGKDLGKVRSDNREVFIRVKLEKVMNLLHMVARLQKLHTEDRDAVDSLIESISQQISSLRQCPANRLFSRFPKMVKDLSIALGKNISVTVVGGEIEMDLDILDQMANAVVHMVRNAIDHGIESPHEREEAGKPFTARIETRLAKQDGKFVFTVADDGRGIDKEALVRTAVNKGLLAPHDVARLEEKNIYDLLLQPGFSTADKVTEISGRGMGMNIVAEILKTLHGTISVQSEPGAGTTFVLAIPDSKPDNDFYSLDFAQESAILTVHDAVTSGAVNELRAVIYPIVKSEFTRLYIDISRMHMVTSEFIGFLVTLNLLLQETSKKLYIVNTTPEHNDALQLAHINKMVEVITSI